MSQKFQGGEYMKLTETVHQSKKALLLAPVVVLALFCIIRFFAFNQECRELQAELDELNQIESRKNAAPALFIESRPNSDSRWSATGLIIHPHQNFQIKVSFWNNLETTCTQTRLEGITNSKQIEMVAGGRYYDTKGEDYTCVLNVDDNRIQLFTGDQYPDDIFFFEQTYTGKIPLFGEKSTAAIQYIVFNEHFITTATHYVGYVPFLSWTEVIIFAGTLIYLVTAILWEAYDTKKENITKTTSKSD